MTVSGITKYNYQDTLKAVEKREAELSKPDQILVDLETNEKSVSLPTLWLVWIVFGMWGGHRFYMHKDGAKLALILMTLAILTLVFFVGFGIMLGLFIWKIVDACHLNRWYHFNRLAVKQHLVQKYLKASGK